MSDPTQVVVVLPDALTAALESALKKPDRKSFDMEGLSKAVQLALLVLAAGANAGVFLLFESKSKALDVSTKSMQLESGQLELTAKRSRNVKAQLENHFFGRDWFAAAPAATVEPSQVKAAKTPPSHTHGATGPATISAPQPPVEPPAQKPKSETVGIATTLTVSNEAALPVEILSNHVQVFVGHAEPDLKKASLVNDPPAAGFVTWGTPVLDTTYSGEHRGNTGVYASKQSSEHTYNHLVPLTDGDWLAIRFELALLTPAELSPPGGSPKSTQVVTFMCRIDPSGNDSHLACNPNLVVQQEQAPSE